MKKKRIVMLSSVVLALVLIAGIWHCCHKESQSSSKVSQNSTNQMAYFSGTELFYLNDMNNPKNAIWVDDINCAPKLSWFSEDGNYLYYYKNEDVKKEKVLDDEMFEYENEVYVADVYRVAVSDLSKKKKQGKSAFSCISRNVHKVRGNDAFVFLDTNHSLLLFENGKKQELAKNVDNYEVTPDQNGVVYQTDQNYIFYMCLDDLEEKALGNEKMHYFYFVKTDNCIYCYVYKQNDSTYMLYSISENGELTLVDDPVEEWDSNLNYVYQGNNLIYYKKTTEKGLLEDRIEMDFTNIKVDDFLAIYDFQYHDEIKELYNLAMNYFKQNTEYTKTVYSLYISENGKEGKCFLDNVTSSCVQKDVIVYNKVIGDGKEKIPFKNMMNEILKETWIIDDDPQNEDQRSAEEKLKEQIDWIISIYGSIETQTLCYRSGTESQIDLAGWIDDMKWAEDNHLYIRTELESEATMDECFDDASGDENDNDVENNDDANDDIDDDYDTDNEPTSYLYDVAFNGNAVSGVRKMEDSDGFYLSYETLGDTLYYFNINGDLCSLKNGKEEKLIRDLSNECLVQFLENGAILSLNDTILSLYENGQSNEIATSVDQYQYVSENCILYTKDNDLYIYNGTDNECKIASNVGSSFSTYHETLLNHPEKKAIYRSEDGANRYYE